MTFEIKYDSRSKKTGRVWVVSRVGGKYEQHAHFRTKEQAKQCINSLKSKKLIDNKYFITAYKRLLTQKEYASLNKKERFYNPNKGFKNKIRI